jgi:hypothetical protein
MLTQLPHTANQTIEDQIANMIQHKRHAIDVLNQVVHGSMPTQRQYHIGDQVWLEVAHLHMPYQMSKMNPRRYGPFQVTEEISPVVFQLCLLPAWQIHDVFHASLLSPYHETAEHGANFLWLPPDIIDGEEEQEIECILGYQLFGKKWRPQYLIKWKGFLESDNEWVFPEFMHAPDLIKAYYHRHLSVDIKEASLSGETQQPILLY